MYTYIYIQCQIYLLDFIKGKPTCNQIKQLFSICTQIMETEITEAKRNPNT